METIVRWTNRIALFVGIALIYWVFIAVSIEVFGFKVFRQNMTESFFLSIFALIALMAGAVIVNVSFNLTRIANHLTQHSVPINNGKGRREWLWIVGLLVLFPVLFGGLYMGDLATSAKRERLILASAQNLTENNESVLRDFTQYTFTKEYLEKIGQYFNILQQYDEKFPQVQIIVLDKLDETNLSSYLIFGPNRYIFDDKEKEIEKSNYIYSTSEQERAYLEKVFAGKTKDHYFSAHDGFYELYYPVTIDNRTIVLYLSDRQAYGKNGS